MSALIEAVDLQPGEYVRVRFTGPAARVYLVDEVNRARYQAGMSFTFRDGGFHYGQPSGTEVDLRPPHHGRWYVLVDHGGVPGFLSASLGVVPELPP